MEIIWRLCMEMEVLECFEFLIKDFIDNFEYLRFYLIISFLPNIFFVLFEIFYIHCKPECFFFPMIIKLNILILS